MDIEDRKEIQGKVTKNIFNKIKAETPERRKGHPDTGGFQNIKQTRSEKRYL
jgi:hypothetical protein